jgi:hypothetical protein
MTVLLVSSTVNLVLFRSWPWVLRQITVLRRCLCITVAWLFSLFSVFIMRLSCLIRFFFKYSCNYRTLQVNQNYKVYIQNFFRLASVHDGETLVSTWFEPVRFSDHAWYFFYTRQRQETSGSGEYNSKTCTKNTDSKHQNYTSEITGKPCAMHRNPSKSAKSRKLAEPHGPRQSSA